MKIKLKDSYDGPIPKDTLHEALRGKNAGYDSYVVVFEKHYWYISSEFAEEIDEFEEEFKSKCHLISKEEIGYLGGYLLSEGGWVFLNGVDRLVWKEDIPSLLLALLKLMDDD